jgi:hypothetical protein
LVPAAFAVVCTHSSFKGLASGRRPVVKTVSEYLSQHDENICSDPTYWDKGWKKKTNEN